MRLTIAGMRIGLQTESAILRTVFQEKYGGFLDQGPSPVGIRFIVEQREYDPRTSLHFELTGESSRLTFRSCACDGWFDTAEQRGEMRVVAGYPAMQDCAANFLRYVSSYLAADQQKLVLHASGVYNTQMRAGYVFAGVSGAGKSTIALLSSDLGHEVLNDDLVVCGLVDGRPTVHGTPFCGDIRYKRAIQDWIPVSNRTCRLGGLYLIEQSAEPAVLDLPMPDQVASLLGSVLYLNHFPCRRVERVMDTLSELTARRSVQSLRFSKDPRFWDAITEGA